MSDERTLKSNSYIFNGIPFLYLAVEAFMYVFYDMPIFDVVAFLTVKFKNTFLFEDGHILYSRALGLILIFVSSIGTRPKKSLNIDFSKHVTLPLVLGLIFYCGSLIFYVYETDFSNVTISNFEILYLLSTFFGAILINLAADNISKIIRIGFMKDKFNNDNESFHQPDKPYYTDYSLNLPMIYYHNKKNRKGWFNLTNPFRGTLVIGTPESGKTFSIIIPFMKNWIQRSYTSIIYDYKYPDLTEIAYYEHLKLKKTKKDYKHRFYVVNLNDVQYSQRVNPLSPKYLEGLPDCIETAEALVQSLQKSVSSQGADKFFQLSAINFLAAIFYFFSKFEGGKYSTLPHALAFMNRDYEEIFTVLLSMPELDNIMSPFKSAHLTQTYAQLEGQIGTLRVNMAPLATPELFWVLSAEDFDLRISNENSPAHLIIANNPKTESINSTSNALILNRLTKLVNTKHNIPSAIIIDELPTIYFHKIQSLIATARSNKVAVVLGLQELPQLVESFGQQVANTIQSVIGNVISGQARKKETLDWLQQLFGRVKQIKTGVSITKQQTTTSVNEQMDFLVPASKIADQKTGEIVAKLAFGFNDGMRNFDNTNTYNCKINLDLKKIEADNKQYISPPLIYKFQDTEHKNTHLIKNMESIKGEVEYIVQQFPIAKKKKKTY